MNGRQRARFIQPAGTVISIRRSQGFREKALSQIFHMLQHLLCTHLRGADSAGAMIWMWNACHRLLCLNTWSPVGVLKVCGTFKRQKLAGRSGLLEASLNFLGTVPPPVCSLLPDYKHNVINSFLLRWPYLPCPVGIYSLKLEARINPSLDCFLPGILSQQEK